MVVDELQLLECMAEVGAVGARRIEVHGDRLTGVPTVLRQQHVELGHDSIAAAVKGAHREHLATAPNDDRGGIAALPAACGVDSEPKSLAPVVRRLVAIERGGKLELRDE